MEGKLHKPRVSRCIFVFVGRTKKTVITTFISDIREQAIIKSEDRKWFETVAMPKAVEQGLKAAAVVFNGNVFKKYYVNVILQATNKFGLPVKVFSEVSTAEDWLVTKK